ncbi:MAG: Peptidase metallopeptidase [Ilumatobacteraceae bacterium]|nr:Peptidase metallopeptidase [Ilumatobacteraceae bacterium]
MSVSDDPPGDGPGDPFDGLELDDDWAQGASYREPSARTRSRRADLSRRDAEESEAKARARKAARRRRFRRRGAVVMGLVAFIAAVAIADRNPTSGGDGSSWSSFGDDGSIVAVSTRPPAKTAESSKPLGEPAHPDADGGRYGFLETQADGETPVTYDPCRPITIVVNQRDMPDGLEDVFADAVATAAEISGLDLTIEGETDERPKLGRSAYQPDRYGQRWAPVLMAWSDEDEIPELADTVAGIGDSVSVEPETGPRTYVSGIVIIDAGDAREIERMPDGDRIARDIVLHELGHLIGLAHVDDPSELMYPEGQDDLHNYQQGDQTGLTQLGQGPCIAQL